MLRVPVQKLAPGMVLARPIPLPNDPCRFLLQRDREVPSDLIPRLQALGITEVWIRHRDFEFLENLVDFYDAADVESTDWRALVTVWWNTYVQDPVGVSALFAFVEMYNLNLELGMGTERSQKTGLGNRLRDQQDRVYEIQVGEQEKDTIALRITSAGTKSGAKLYKLIPVK